MNINKAWNEQRSRLTAFRCYLFLLGELKILNLKFPESVLIRGISGRREEEKNEKDHVILLLKPQTMNLCAHNLCFFVWPNYSELSANFE